MASADDTRPLHDIPRLKDLAIDGGASGWKDDGLRVHAFAEDGAEATARRDISADARVAWTERGLAVLVDVASAAPWAESASERVAFEQDSVEIFLRLGSEWKRLIQAVLSPGMTPQQPELRSYLWDYRGPLAEWNGVAATVECARKRRAGGFTLEALLPWANLRFQPAAGAEVECRINVNKRLPGQGRRQLTWREAGGDEFHRLRLSEKAGAPIETAGWLVADPLRGLCANAIAPEAEAGRAFRVLREGKELAAGLLRAEAGRARGWLALPLDAADGTELKLAIGETIVGSGKPVHPRQALRDQLYLSWRIPPGEQDRATEIAPRVPQIFAGTELPAAAPGDARLMALAGVTGIETRWFDETFAEVTRAEKPGRYGAIVTMTLEGADPITHYRSAWKIEGGAAALGAALAQAFKLADGGASTQAALGQPALEALAGRGDLAKALAAAAAGETSHASALDRAWWHRLRTRLGTQTMYPYFRLLPQGYDQDPDKRWPAILYLHGSGGRFPRDYAPIEKRTPNRDLHGWAAERGVPFAIYSLQCFGGWEPPAVVDALDRILKEDRIDPDRVIIMGFSMGGMGTWFCAVDYPERWAAAVPLGGRGDRAAEVARVKHLPIWTFNGDRDESTTLEDALKIVEPLRKIGGNIRLTVLEGAGHGETQHGAFENKELWSWLAEQKRAR